MVVRRMVQGAAETIGALVDEKQRSLCSGGLRLNPAITDVRKEASDFFRRYIAPFLGAGDQTESTQK